MKRTAWYPAEVNPVREGCYQVWPTAGGGMSYWNGRHWLSRSSHAYSGTESYLDRTAFPVKRWRGILKAPA